MTRSSDCRKALDLFQSRRFSQWQGLPSCRRSDLDRRFAVLTRDVVRSVLGSEGRPSSYVSYEVPGYAERVSAWLDRDRVIMLETEFPTLVESADDIRDRLGEPEGKLDFRIHVAVNVEGGVWVWPARGLALYLNPKKDNYLFRLAVFGSTTLDEFEAGLKIDPKMDEM